jgi:[ribosomal protein S5]-alanine N-acetyltransferase
MIPTLKTPRLLLRPFTLADAPCLQELASDERVAAGTARIPHPNPAGSAARSITSCLNNPSENRLPFAITLAAGNDPVPAGQLIGRIGLSREDPPQIDHATLGYWLGVAHWNHGYATEAAAAVLHFAFTQLQLAQISADHFAHNPASGRVLQKIGMTYTHASHEFFPVRNAAYDLRHYAITRDQWLAHKNPARLDDSTTRRLDDLTTRRPRALITPQPHHPLQSPTLCQLLP